MSKQQHDTLPVRKAPWTAAPINTLKRSLAQAIAEVEENNQHIRLQLAKRRRSDVIRDSYLLTHPKTAQSTTTEPHPDDPDWALRQSQKKKANVRVTYGANALPTRRLTFGHGRRVSSNNNTPPSASSGPIHNQYHHRRISSNNSNCPSALGTKRHGLYRPQKRSKRLSLDGPREALVIAFQDVLRQTNLNANPEQQEASRTGAPSLASVCLRTVPRAIEQEQKLRDEEDEGEKTDVQAEVMSVLMERPWAGYPKSRHMAEIVRARAVLQVRQAVLGDTIRANELRELLACCIANECFREAGSLTGAWFDRYHNPEESSGDIDNLGLILASPFPNRGRVLASPFTNGIEEDSKTTYWTSYHYRQMNLALQAAIMPPLAWWPTNISNLIKAATNSTTTGAEASEFLLGTMRCCMRTAQFEKRMEVELSLAGKDVPVSEVLSHLVAAAINTSRLSLAWPVRCAVEESMNRPEQDCLEARMLVIASNILLDIVNIYPVSTSDKHIIWFCDLATQATDIQLNHIAEMICSTAHDLAFISSTRLSNSVATNSTIDRTFDFLHDVLEHLLCHDGISKHKVILRQLVLSTALAFANNSFSPRRVAYARSIESRITGLRRTEEGTETSFFSPDKPATKRWEEGICEWVSITPAVPKPPPVVSKPLPMSKPLLEFKTLSDFNSLPELNPLPESQRLPEPKPAPAINSLPALKPLPEFKPLPDFKPLPEIPVDEERWEMSMGIIGKQAPLTPPTSPLAAITIGVETQLPLPAAKSEAKPFPRSKRMLQLDGACDDFDYLPSSSASGSASASTFVGSGIGRVEPVRSRDAVGSKRPRLSLFERTISEQNTRPLRRVLRKAKSFLTLQAVEGEGNGDDLA